MKYGTKFFYQNEQNDEVVHFKLKKTKINDKYKYFNNNILYRISAWLSYNFIALPITFLKYKVINHVKVHNKKTLLSCQKEGCFIYSNHTNQYLDAIFPAIICYPKKPHIICSSDNVSIPIIGKLNKMWGAIPVPDTIIASKNFNKKIELEVNKHNPIVIYPEAHLWPYYTKIRNFSAVSFRFPIKFNKPIFVFTTIYKKKKVGKKPKIEIFIDGPLYFNDKIEPKIAQKELRDAVFNKMKERAKNSNYNFCIYEKGDKND